MNTDTLNQHIGVLANGCRSYRQFLDMIDKIERGICPFCEDHFDHEKNKIIGRAISGDIEWVMWVNPYGHDNTQLHIVMIPKRHLTHIEELTPDDWVAIGELNAQVMRDFDVPGGGFAMRFGDASYNAGSLGHLHGNIMVPDRTGNVKITLAKDPKKQLENETRVDVFTALYEAGKKVEDLNDYAKLEGVITISEFNTVVLPSIE